MGKKNDVVEAAERLGKAAATMLIEDLGVQSTIGEGPNDNIRVEVTVNGVACQLGLTWNKDDEQEDEEDEE